MTESHDNSAGRRDFLISGLRAFFLGIIALLCGALAVRGKRLSNTAQGCTVQLPCRACPNIGNCTDPKARESKRTAVSPAKDSEQ